MPAWVNKTYEMKYNRRRFIKLSGSAGTGIALSTMMGGSLLEACTEKVKPVFGLQLYTLRDVLPADPKAVLKQVAAYGYKQIESYEGPKGMFWGMSNMEFRKYMDELGMRIVASHSDIEKDFERKAADAAAIGMEYLLCAWKGPQKSIDDFKRFADEFNSKGKICRKHGIRFAYHNHDYSFKPVDGQLPQDVMMQGTDPALVDFEMDIYWVVTAGEDPEKWLKKYKDRFRLCHVKDRSKTAGTDNGKNSVDLGAGVIDFSKVLRTAKENGMKYFIVEQEYYENSTPMKSAEAGANYMSGLDI